MTRILREDDSEAVRLRAAGWTVAHRSWGARLTEADPAVLRAAVTRAEAAQYLVGEGGPPADAGIAALARATRADYPGGPATAPAVVTSDAIAAARASGTRYFVATWNDEVVAVTAIRAAAERAETDFTSVEAAHRRRGLAEAVKASSVLALLEGGARVFGTGGAEENAPSVAMNRRLGYRITERWLTLEPPASS